MPNLNASKPTTALAVAKKKLGKNTPKESEKEKNELPKRNDSVEITVYFHLIIA